MVDINLIEDGLLMPPVSETGQLVSFNAPVPLNISTLKVAITPVQSGTGDPSPTNIRPITGWTGASIHHGNKNLLSPSDFMARAQAYLPNCTVDADAQTVRFASNTTITAGLSFTNPHMFKENTQYTFIFTIYKSANTGTNLRVYYKDGSYDNLPSVSATQTKVTVVLVTDSNKTVYSLAKNNSGGTTTIYLAESAILEGVHTAADIVPFVGNTYPVTWSDSAGTVYAGKLDAVRGKLIAYPYYASYNGETLSGEWISDRDVYAEGTTPTIGAQVVDLSGGGTEYTLTPTEITPLVGINNFWADCGDITLKTSPIFGELKIRLMEEGISIVNSSPLLRSASAPASDTEEDTKTEKEPIEDIVKKPVDEKDTVKELPEDETEPEPEDEEVTEDDNEG